jgi:iron complex outermembrane receptor protein
VWNLTPAHWKIFDPYFIDHYGLERRAFQSDLRIDYDFADGYTFSAVTAYHRDKTSVVLDSSHRAEGHLPNPLFTPTNPNLLPNFTFMRMTQGLSRDWSQEVRIASPQDQDLRWTIGGNYLQVKSPGGSVFGYDIRGRAFAASITRSRLKTPAVFGGVYYDIIDQLTLSAEARYQWDKVTQIPFVNLAGNIVTGTAANPLQNTFRSFSPRVSLDYNFAEDAMAYVLFSRGYRPGGFNAALATSTAETLAALQAQAPSAGVTFEEEQLDNYEAGIKSTFLDGRARATLSVYYMRWKNGQSGAVIPVRLAGPPPVTNLVNLTINTGLATLKGYELEGQFQVTDELQVSGSMGLNDSKVGTSRPDLYRCTDCLNIQGDVTAGLGNRLPTAPKWMWALSATYTDHLAGDYDWFARADWSHRGRNYTDFTNLAWVGASDNVNARIGIRTETLSIEGFVTNLTQNRVLAAGLTAVEVYSFAIPPTKNSIRTSFPLKRTFGIRAAYNF